MAAALTDTATESGSQQAISNSPNTLQPAGLPVRSATIEEETEKLRELVVAARDNPKVETEAEACLDRLQALYKKNRASFSEEDIRFINYLRGALGVRLDAHRKWGQYARIAKPKGVKLDHCWRCQTPLDSRFTEVCPHCSTSKSRSFVCPVCRACGCQQAGRVLA
jgi:hypothetical protein